MPHSQGTAVGDNDLRTRLAAAVAVSLDLLNEFPALLRRDLSEDDVLAVEPGGFHGRDEKLGAVGTRPGVGHGEEADVIVLDLEVLVSELFSVDRLSAGAVVVREVTSLEHELRDDPVEPAALVAEAVLACAELSEVSCGLWDDFVEEVEDHSAGFLPVDGDVEVALRHWICLVAI